MAYKENESIFEQESIDVILYALNASYKGLKKGSIAVGGKIKTATLATGNYLLGPVKSLAKFGVLTAAGVAIGYSGVYVFTDRLKPDYNPEHIESVVERKLYKEDYVVLTQKKGDISEFKRVGKDFKRLDDLREEELGQINNNYESEKQEIQKKYNGMEERAKALK